MPLDGISFDVEGLPEVKAMIQDLAEKQVNKAMRKALRKGGRIVRQAISEAAPTKSKFEEGGILPMGALKNDIALSIRKGNPGQFYANIGPGKYTWRVAMWLEYGHRLVKGGYSRVISEGKNKGKTRGHGREVNQVEPHPFIRDAFEVCKAEVTEVVCTTLVEEIVKASKR